MLTVAVSLLICRIAAVMQSCMVPPGAFPCRSVPLGEEVASEQPAELQAPALQLLEQGFPICSQAVFRDG